MKYEKIISIPCLIKAKEKKGITDPIYANISISEEKRIANKNKKYLIKTYGCQANVRDSETLAGLLEIANFQETNNEKEADIIIINTCAVRENAEDKVFGEIGNLKALRSKEKRKIFALCGCMAEEPDIVEKVRKIFPHINLIFGTHEIPHFLDYVDELFTKDVSHIISVKSQAGEIFENLPEKRQDAYKAFVNIMYGCDKFCTYCIVPFTRGRERSRLEVDVLKECKKIIALGYQEITLLGQNVNAYGKDLKDGTSFAGLLEKVAQLGIPRLRFTTSHPWDFSDELIDVIAKYPNIMKAIHLPFQSGNDEILKKMGRRYSSQDYLNLVDRMKSRIPGLTLSTDIIVGFPNETYEQFLDTLKLIDYVKFDFAFTFIYSQRLGTPAAKLKDDITDEEKHRRFNELVKHLEKYVEQSGEKMVGNIFDVLVEGPSKNNKEMFSGYTENNKLVHFKSDESKIGKIIKVKILESRTYSFLGETLDG
ncbi:MAG: tRNA (N6-isopentenyl adenosine(37)-C2)-methylthiotransferase MiaB [Erysipelotrichia bacterium]|nr:tRNA (N6-isopentenyl adenosine(37)-C2)-methylthiotransferase MiaB [Erysipelotrichia bacterium]